MNISTLRQRRKRYFYLSSEIAQVDDVQLQNQFEAAESTQGWGRNHVLEIGKHKVFVKRIPVTQLEFDNPFSTRNLYDLPTYYNYGVGSAGFGVFRELTANIKTTNWVLDGKIETFPLLYHYRLRRFSGGKPEIDWERHTSYINYWGANENVGKYALARAHADHELVLFFEYIPHVLRPWLKENLGHLPSILEQLRSTIRFLKKKCIIHFDVHFHNVMTDGERAYLTDFGLVLDRSFALSEDEQRFFKAHVDYDFGEALSCLQYFVSHPYKELPEGDRAALGTRLSIGAGTSDNARLGILLENVSELSAIGVVPMPATTAEFLYRHRHAITLIDGFFGALSHNPSKDTTFPAVALRRQLALAGYR